uniref:Ig-like domain-containing protein n=2 Tax=Sus scrofa TaxID=9823 RepID=A0A8D0SQ46_PIG
MVRERHSWDLNLTLRLSPGLLGRASSCPADHHTCPNSSAGRGQHHPGCSGLGRGRAPVLQLVRGAGTEMAQQILTFHVISGGLTLGPAHTGQETVKPDGSLHIAGLNLADMGPYTLRKILMDMSHPTWSVYLPVYDGPGVPVINPMDSTFVAGSNLTLSCFASSNPPAAYTWRVDGSPGPAGQLLSILDVSLNSSGLYSCHAANADTGLQSMAQLVVHIKGEGPECSSWCSRNESD